MTDDEKKEMHVKFMDLMGKDMAALGLEGMVVVGIKGTTTMLCIQLPKTPTLRQEVTELLLDGMMRTASEMALLSSTQEGQHGPN